VDDFGMVDVKHKSHYSCNNLLFAHQAQQAYYLSYPHKNIKNWWIVYKVNPKMDTHRYDEYVERHDDDDVVHVYQEEIERHQSFTVLDRAEHAELATRDIELMEEELDPSKKHIRKLKCVTEREERHERLDARVAEADSDADDF
jgi:hypothetical protein